MESEVPELEEDNLEEKAPVEERSRKRKIDETNETNETKELGDRGELCLNRVEKMFDALLILLARSIVEGNFSKGKEILATILPTISQFMRAWNGVQNFFRPTKKQIPPVVQVVYELGKELLGNIIVGKFANSNLNELDILQLFIQTVALQFDFDVILYLLSNSHVKLQKKGLIDLTKFGILLGDTKPSIELLAEALHEPGLSSDGELSGVYGIACLLAFEEEFKQDSSQSKYFLKHGKLQNNPVGMHIIDPRLSNAKKKEHSGEIIKLYVNEKELRVYSNKKTKGKYDWDEIGACSIATRVSYSMEVEITINLRKIRELQENATMHLSKAYESFPITYYLIPLVRANLSKGDVKTALELLVNHCNKFPKEPNAWVQLGHLFLHFSLNQNQQASKCFQIAKDLSPIHSNET